MSFEQEREELGVFQRVLQCLPLDIDASSIHCRPPPEPDILCATSQGAQGAFELVEIADPAWARVNRHINAPRAQVYHALLDTQAVAQWMVPQGMTSQVHEFDAREGGAFRISLTYGGPGGTGTTTASTDTYHGRFVRLVPRELVVQTMAFETSDAAMRGEMTATYPLTAAEGDTIRARLTRPALYLPARHRPRRRGAHTFLRRVPVASGDRLEGENVASPGAGPPMHVTTTRWSRSRCSAGAWAISGRADPTVGLKLMSHDPAGPSSRPRWSTPARAWTK